MPKKLFTLNKGFTLIEMLLVLAVVSSLIYMAIGFQQQQIIENRISRSSVQMQQILVAAASYYVLCNSWPSDIATLQTQGSITCGNSTLTSTGFLPTGAIKSPWGGVAYGVTSTVKNFYVYATITASRNTLANGYATMILGRLPIAYTANSVAATPPDKAACTGTTCYVVAQIGIPPQNINKATGLNFAGVYRHGGCVPVPQCKVDVTGTTMKAQVYVVPVSVSGMNELGNVYPISSFTAYATAVGVNPPACTGGSAVACQPVSPVYTGEQYWRACLQVVTSHGLAAPTGWGEQVTLAAFTRCVPNQDPLPNSGSDFSVFSN